VAAAERGLRNPYRNERLMDLWARGVAAAKANPAIVIPAEYRPKPVKAWRPLPTRRPAPGGSERRGWVTGGSVLAADGGGNYRDRSLTGLRGWQRLRPHLAIREACCHRVAHAFIRRHEAADVRGGEGVFRVLPIVSKPLRLSERVTERVPDDHSRHPTCCEPIRKANENVVPDGVAEPVVLDSYRLRDLIRSTHPFYALIHPLQPSFPVWMSGMGECGELAADRHKF
jgi:hypothetical protein